MAFGKTSQGTCRVYEYGCSGMAHGPTDGEARAVNAMRARNVLWNRLVEIERTYQSEVEAVLVAAEPRLSEIVAALAVAEGDARKPLWVEQKAVRKETFARPEVKAALVPIEETRRAAVKSAREKSVVYWWANYDDVESAHRIARQKPGSLKFHAWRNERGKLSLRWQTGLPVAQAFGTDHQLQIMPVPDDAWTAETRGERRRLARTTVWFRVATEERRAVWLTLPIVLHRPLPTDGVIRSAAVLRERVGSHERWKLTLTVSLPERQLPPVGRGRIGIDIGWRKRPDGVRVAYWHDDQGRSAEVVVPNRWFVAMAKVEELRSIRDQAFNVARESLVRWLDGRTVPEWFREATATIRQWRSPARLAALAVRWREARFDGDGEHYQAAEEWRQHDKHLWNWEANQRDQLLKARREQYRQFAVWVTREYGEMVIERFDLRPMARLDQEGGDLVAEARAQRFSVACSEFRLCLKNACEREGVAVVEAPARNTTRQCHVCGQTAAESIEGLVYVCPSCGNGWDQDANAARNLLSGMVPQTVGVL